MLDEIPPKYLVVEAFRFEAVPDYMHTLEELGLDLEHIDEMRELLRERRMDDTLEGQCDRRFEKQDEPFYQSRFTDGSYPVYYTALEAPTAEQERKHHSLKQARQTQITTFYYQLISCRFAGDTKDLRPYVSEWPWLVSEDLTECNRVGKEAVGAGLGGLLTASARRADGTCLPVFRREVINNFRRHEWIKFVYDSSTGQMSSVAATATTSK